MHLYPVLDADTKRSVSQCGRISLNESKFSISYDNYLFCEKMEEIQIEDEDECIDLKKANEYQFEIRCENEDEDEDEDEDERGICLEKESKEPSFDELRKKAKVLLYDDSKDIMMQLMYSAMNEIDENGQQFMIDHIKFSAGRPIAFKHPISKKIIEVTTNFTERRQIVNELSEEYGKHIIKFENQSYAQIAISIFDNQFGSVSQLSSNLSDKIFDILDENHLSAFIGTVSLDQEQGETGHGYDITKSYASGILNNETDYAVFQPFDEVKPFTNDCEMVVGEYYISCDIKINKDMKLSKGYYPLVFVKELLRRKVIKKSNITMYIPAKLFIKADIFKSFVQHIYTKYSSDDAKKMINFFIGGLGTKYSKIDTGCITTEFEIACALQIQYSADHNISIDKYEDLYFVRAQTKTKKFNTALPIHRHIICLGIINMINLYDAVVIPESKVISFNTDSIMLRNPNLDIKNFAQSKDSTLESLGKIRTEDWKIKSSIITEVLSRELEIFKPVEWNIVKEGADFTDFCQTVFDSTSAVIIGGGGFGKTEVIKNLISREKTCLVLAFTNKAIENIISRSGSDKNIFTFDSFLNDHLDDDKKEDKLSQYKKIIIEEYSMCPVRFLNILNKFKSKNPSTTYIFVGDNNQCLQVDSNKIIYDYIQTSTFNKMCNGNMFECSYKEQYSRYDMALKTELDYFLVNDKIQDSLKDNSEIISYHNICRSADKKWKTNQECSFRYRKENPTFKTVQVELTKDIKSKSTKFKYNFTEGEELMCIDKIITKNTDGSISKLINGSICNLTSIEEDKIVINDLKMDISTFILKFEPNYCQTIYKYQGSTIDAPYNIYELHYLTKRELYTAMSRGKRLSDVHFKFTPRLFLNEDCSASHELTVKINNEIDEKYMNGKIYKITFNNDIYIGSTIQTLEERKDGHLKTKKPDRKSNMFIEKLENFKDIAKIELIKLYPCKSLNELVFEEMRILDEYINDKKLNILNTIGNRKKNEIKDVVIVQERLDAINIPKDQFQIVENIKKNILRISTIVFGQKVDINVSMNKKTKEEATMVLEEKFNKIKKLLEIKVGKCSIDWI